MPPRTLFDKLWSGAISPARAPASIDMLHTVMRSSIDIARIVLPRYSMTWPVPPLTPITPITCRIRSLALTPSPSAPSMVIASVFGLRCSRHCVASTWPTSEVPMPNASAPNAPCVAVWLSPQTMVMPGWVMPSSGPITCTMPRCALPKSNSSTPKAAAFSRSFATCASASGFA